MAEWEAAMEESLGTCSLQKHKGWTRSVHPKYKNWEDPNEKSNLKHDPKTNMEPEKNGGFGSMFLLFQGCIVRFHVSFRGGT